MNFNKQLKDGLIYQNPVLVQVLGMCSTMAITTSFFNGLGMGVSVLIILTLSNIFISLLRKIIPNEVRIACYIVVIAGFVTCVDLLLKAFVPALSSSLGVFIPLIVVNCIILGHCSSTSPSTTSPSTRPGTAAISRTTRRPSRSRAAWTTMSIDEATVGTTNRAETFSPASSGRVHIFVTASRALLA